MFAQLIGNQRVKESLIQLLRSERVPNSLLCAGPEGVGKKQFAFELARAFVCQDLEDHLACGKCPACRRVGGFAVPASEKGEDYDRVFFGEHPDVGLVIPFKRNLRVGAIRALEREANFRPYEARARVFIVDDAEKMNDAASNALLKTLEEPSFRTYLILIASRAKTLLYTIRSRCQTIRFAPVAEREVAEFLIERLSCAPAEAKLAARITGGSVGDALMTDLKAFRSMRANHFSAVEKAFIHGDKPALLRISEQMNDTKNKDAYESSLSILESVVRDIWLWKTGAREELVRNIDEADRIGALAVQIETDKLKCALREIESLRQSFAVNINRKSGTDALFMKIAA